MQPANILKIESLDEGWGDKDDVLLHACFQLLVDFYETELAVTGRFINWEATPATRQAREEIEQLYAWWQEWKKTATIKTHSFAEDATRYAKENEMLQRLIQVRGYMWT